MSDTLETVQQQYLQELVGYSEDGSRITRSIDVSRLPHNEATNQRLAVHVMMAVLEDDALMYIDFSNEPTYSFKMKYALEEVHKIDRLKSISDMTLRRWLSFYVSNGFMTRAACKQENKKHGIKRKYVSSFTADDMTALLEIVHEAPQLYLDEIQAEMLLQRGKEWSIATLWGKLRSAGYSLQKAAFRARQMSLEEQTAYRIRMDENVHDARQVVFIDESARGVNASRRERAWSIQGKTPVLDSFFDAHNAREQYTFLAAVDCDGFITEACEIVLRERGQDDNDQSRGTIDTERFEAWVEEKLVPTLGNYALHEPRSIVVMDNAIIHCSDRVRNLIEGAGALIIFTAPYSPHLNPIEYMFSIYKAKLRRIGSTMDWLSAHYEAMAAVTPEFAHNEFCHCNVPGWENLYSPIESMARKLGVGRNMLMVMILVVIKLGLGV